MSHDNKVDSTSEGGSILDSTRESLDNRRRAYSFVTWMGASYTDATSWAKYVGCSAVVVASIAFALWLAR